MEPIEIGSSIYTYYVWTTIIGYCLRLSVYNDSLVKLGAGCMTRLGHFIKVKSKV